MSDTSAPRRRRREATPPRSGRPSPRTGAIIVLAAFALAIAGVIWLAAAAVRWLSPAGGSVVVPNLVGMQFDGARSTAKTAGLGVRVVARKPDYRAPKDRVVGQLPAAGEHVREGRVIDVIVSDGQPQTRVPNVANMSVRDATVALENARLRVGSVSARYDADVPEATVLDQQPEALSPVAAGSAVDLVVAKGRPVAYAPNFIGMPASSAAAAAKDAHVTLAPFVQMPLTPSAPPKGVIVGQSPPPGQILGIREAVTLQVSGGAPPGLPPSPAAVQATAGPASSISPTAQRGLRVSVALPQLDQPSRVRVVLRDAAGARTLYDQQTRGGFTLSFDLTVTGAGMLQTFVGDALVNSTPL